MPIDENDLELLDLYLDGEMPVIECEGLWRRLAAEPALAAELDRLRADHALRVLAWSSCEPADQNVAAVEARIMRGTRRQEIMLLVNRGLKVTAVAAACLMFGFSVGWMGHDRYATNHATANVAADINTQAQHKFVVAVPDNAGHAISMGQFDTYDDAQHFAADLASHQARTNQDSHDSSVIPAVDEEPVGHY